MVVAHKRTVIGWREWVGLPDLGIRRVKVKVDTGARTSAIHAWDLRRYRAGGCDMVDFMLHPRQRDDKRVVAGVAEVIDERSVRSSNGQVSRRPVVLMRLEVGEESLVTQVTLVDRDEMGFRMLLGRRALAKRFVVDPARSYVVSSKGKKSS